MCIILIFYFKHIYITNNYTYTCISNVIFTYPATCTIVCDFPWVRYCSALDLIPNWPRIFLSFFPIMIFSLNYIFPITKFSPIWNWARGGCERSVEDANYSQAHDSTSIFKRSVLLGLEFIWNFDMVDRFVIFSCN